MIKSVLPVSSLIMVGLCCVGINSNFVYADQKTAIWSNPVSSHYDLPTNWNPAEVPLNNPTDTFIVQIPGTPTVTYDVRNPQQIDELLLDTNATLNLVGDGFIFRTDLTVLGQSLIAGTIEANNADLTATGVGTLFVGSRARVMASNTADVIIAAPAYSSTGIIPDFDTNGGTIILSATDTDTSLDLSNVTSLDMGFDDVNNSVRTQVVRAAANGVINLSSVTELTSPARSEDRVNFEADFGGQINLSSLQTIKGLGKSRFLTESGSIDLTSLIVIQNPVADTGGAVFTANSSGNITIGPIERADRTAVNVNNSSNISLGGFAGSAQITDSTFKATGGGVLQGSTLMGTYTTTAIIPDFDFNGGTTILEAKDNGSKLDLSGLTSFNAGFDDNSNSSRTQVVSATAGGVIDLSSVTVITNPAQTEDRLNFVANDGQIDLSAVQTINGSGKSRFLVTGGPNSGSIDLSNLVTIQGTEAHKGGAIFIVNSSGSITVGPLERMDETSISINSGATMTAGGFNGQAQITNSTFAVTGTGQLNGATLIGTYSSAGITPALDNNGGVIILAAFGAGSMLDLSGLTSVNAGFDDPSSSARTQVISARDGGTINLSSVTTVTGPVEDEDRLNFESESGAMINLSAVQSVGGSGKTRFIADGGTIDLTALETIQGPNPDTGGAVFTVNTNGTVTVGAVQRIDRTTINVNSDSTMSIGGFVGSTQIIDSIFAVTGGGQLNGATLIGTYSTTGLSPALDNDGGTTILAAKDAESVLDLSGVTSLDTGFNNDSNDARTQVVSASTGGLVVLSGVTQIITPDRAEDSLRLTISSGGKVDLSSLNEVTGPGKLWVAVNGGNLTIGPLQQVDDVVFDLDAQTVVEAPGSVTLGVGQTVQIEIGEPDNTGATEAGLAALATGSSSQINVTDQANLSATLEIDRVDDFDPTYGDTWQVMTYSSRDGSFVSILGSVLTDVLALAPMYENDRMFLLATAPGDANGDGQVGFADFGILQNHFNQEGSWQDGDFNGDGMVTFVDFSMLQNNFNQHFFGDEMDPASGSQLTALSAFAAAAVPEPGTIWLLTILLSSLSLSRSRRYAG